jgi:hypothetical protein
MIGPMLVPPHDLPAFFGSIDIYLFDQLLKGRLQPGCACSTRAAAAGATCPTSCATASTCARSTRTPQAVAAVRRLAAELAPRLPPENFRVEALDALSFPDEHFDAVVASAVLHFADDDAHFRAMVDGCWRVLRRGGLLLRPARVLDRHRGPDRTAGRRTLPSA